MPPAGQGAQGHRVSLPCLVAQGSDGENTQALGPESRAGQADSFWKGPGVSL